MLINEKDISTLELRFSGLEVVENTDYPHLPYLNLLKYGRLCVQSEEFSSPGFNKDGSLSYDSEKIKDIITALEDRLVMYMDRKVYPSSYCFFPAKNIEYETGAGNYKVELNFGRLRLRGDNHFELFIRLSKIEKL